MKEQILEKLFNSRWNTNSCDVHKKVIALFYQKGGFSGLYEYILNEKERMSKDKDFPFKNYYSLDLIETLKKAKEQLSDFDFEGFILNDPLYPLDYNKTNFLKLKEYKLLQYFSYFDDYFRGDIVALHKVGSYSIIETFSRRDGVKFYPIANISTCYETLETALIYCIYKGEYYDTLLTLLESVNKSK